MSEASKVRLVRCPKCENLLPELADYSVYQCGGCGVVLRAKNKNFEGDTMSQKSDEEMVQGVSGKFSGKSDNFNFPEKVMNLNDGSENDVKSNGSCSSGRSDRNVVLGNIVDNQSSGLSMKADKLVVNNDLELNENLDELGRVEMGEEFEESKPSNGIANGSQISRGVAEIVEDFEGLKPPNRIANGFGRSSRVADWRSGEGDDSEGFWRNPRKDAEGMRYSASKYLEDGPSNYHMTTSDYGEPAKNQNKYDEVNKVEYLEQDRAELLRKLDELKDQINRSCDVNDKAKEKVPFDRGLVPQAEPYGGSETWFPDGSRGTRASVQYMPDMYVARPYVSHYPEASLHMNRHEMDMQRFYPPNQVQRFGDPLRSQMLRRAPQQGPVPLQQQAAYPYYSRQYVKNDMDPFETYPPHMNLHHPSCSCVRCYNKHPQVPAPVPPAAFHGKTFSEIPNKSMFYHHENPSAFGPRDYNPEIANPRLLNPHYPQSHTRWPSDLNSEVGGFVHRYPPRVVLATGGQRCHPIGGGAPFVTCNNCFELLQLPKKILLMEKNQKKVQCGACSTVILFAVVNNKLVVSVHSEKKKTPNMVDDSPSTTAGGGTLHSHGHANQASMNFSSDDYDNSGYDFQAMDREMISSSTGKSAEMRSLQSTSLCSSDNEGSPESLNARGEESNSAELAAKANPSPPLAGSPLQEHFDYSTIYNRSGKGNQSGRLEREEPKKATLRQNSMKDSSLPTEMEVSFNEYSHTGTSQESGNGSREEDQLRVTKGGQSFFASIMKKSFKDLSKSNQTIEQSTNVKINGHPIPDRLLKKAEKLAGPIHPGQYWYDFRAGFWGVMDGPCLGIVPPFIEEFNYPMPENCAGGDTGIFVNGRELHQKDLRLLSSRGLPTFKDRSYIIEISGRVLDEDSGEELDGLGKLAPTIEKVKHGFGMKVPRVAK